MILKTRKASTEKRAVLVPNPKAKLFDQIREVMRFHHYSYRTERTYSQWVRRYLTFHRQPDCSGPEGGWRHPSGSGLGATGGARRRTGGRAGAPPGPVPFPPITPSESRFAKSCGLAPPEVPEGYRTMRILAQRIAGHPRPSRALM